MSQHTSRFLTNASKLWLYVMLAMALVGTSPSQTAQPSAPQTQSNPAPAVPAAAPVAPAAVTPSITSVTLYQESAPAAAPTPAGGVKPPAGFVLEVSGTGFSAINTVNLRVLVFPSTGVGEITDITKSTDNLKIWARFTAPSDYALQQVALSLDGSSFVTFSVASQICNFQNDVIVEPQIVTHDQAKTKYGNGVAANFNVVQVSIVNKCSVPIIVPLAGISIQPEGLDKGTCKSEGGAGDLVPFSLDHVTSIYSANRKLTGARAIYFNALQALATLGSAVEPFFAHGFTQGVAILGGGFTTASKEISVDMSTEQLQNITAQSFGATEQVSPGGGPLQKFVFIRRNQKCKDSVREQNIRTGNFKIKIEMVVASPQAPASKQTSAVPSAPAVQ